MIFASTSAFSAGVDYCDVEGHWAKNVIEEWSGLGVIGGHDGSFYPDRFITRGEFATVINRVFQFGIPAENTFSDLDNSFYTRHILCLSYAGVMSGFEDEIRPNDYITREEAGAVFYKVLALDEQAEMKTDFSDAEQISDWAMPYMTTLVNEGYFGGSDGRLNPKQNITRAETVALLSKALFVADENMTDGSYEKICIISRDGLSISGKSFAKDVVVTPNVSKLSIEDTQISGRIRVLTAKPEAVYLKDCTAAQMVSENPNALVVESTKQTEPEIPEEKPVEEVPEENNDDDEYIYDYYDNSGSYADDDDDADDESQKPTIETTLEDNLLQRNSKKVFDVIAKDKNGEKIEASVKLNDIAIEPSWDDDAKTSYTLEFFEDGEYTISISATDSEGNTKTKEFTLTYEMAEYGEVIGKATVSVEAFTVGGGYVIAPMEIDVCEGMNCAYVLDELFLNENLSYDSTGSLDGGFYLAAISDIPEFTPAIPAALETALSDAGFSLDTDMYTPGRLSEFDFTQGSGWMYCVNGVFPNVGFSEYYLQDGDVIRIQFTLAYGSDIGGCSGAGYSYAGDFYDMVNRDELTKKISELGISACTDYMDLITKPDLTEDELESVMSGLD